MKDDAGLPSTKVSLSSASARISGRGRSKGVPEPEELRPGGESCVMKCSGSNLSDVGVNISPGIFSGSPRQARLLTLASPFGMLLYAEEIQEKGLCSILVRVAHDV
jgi:hypothetical protein